MPNDIRITELNTLSSTAATNYIPVTDGVRTTKLGTDALFGSRNRIINGDMRIAQRGTSFTQVTNNTYTLDRYKYNNSNDGQVTISQQSDAPTGFNSSLKVSVTNIDVTMGTTQRARILHTIEGYNISDLVGVTFTFSFWVKTNKTGNYSATFANIGNGTTPDRSYVAPFTVNAADTWEYKTITVIGGIPNSGTWNYTTGIGLIVGLTLACGTGNQTASVNQWVVGSNFSTNDNPVNLLDNVVNYINFTGLQLEVGATATSFERRPYGLELSLCQRYLPVVDVSAYRLISADGATIAYMPLPLPVQARVAPSSLATTGTFTIRTAGGLSTPSATLTFNAAAVDSAIVNIDSTGLTAGQCIMLLGSAGSKLFFNGCEL